MRTALTKVKETALFVFRTFVPTDEDFWVARQALKADLAWQPYLYAAILFGSLGALFFGDVDLLPPLGAVDGFWLFFGIVSPLLGFLAAILLKMGTGRPRYIAFWLRIAANLGIITAILTYQLALGDQRHIMSATTSFASIAFLIVLIVKDSHFLVMTERVAKQLRE